MLPVTLFCSIISYPFISTHSVISTHDRIPSVGKPVAFYFKGRCTFNHRVALQGCSRPKAWLIAVRAGRLAS